MISELYYGLSDEMHDILINFLKTSFQQNKTNLIYYQKSICIKSRNDIYNSVVFFNQLEDSKVYRLTVESIDLLEGVADEVTFLIRDNLHHKAVFASGIKIGKINEVIFTTGLDAYNLELKFYSGEIKKASNISVKLNNIKLEIIGSNEYFDEHLKFIDKANQVYLGEKLAQLYCNDDDSTFYLIVNRYIGDSVKYLRLIKSFKEYYAASAPLYHYEAEKELFIFKKRKNIKKIVVITTPENAGVARLYSDYIDSIIELSREELVCLEMYTISGATKFRNIIPDEDVDYRITGKHNVERTEVKAYLYGVGDLLWNLGIPNNMDYPNMRINEITSKNTDLLIKKLGIDCNNTIIICPNSQSSSVLNETMWNRLIAELTVKGKRVLVNIAAGEKTVYGATPLDCSIDVICDLVKRGCWVVGVQCELLDVIAEFNDFRKLIVLCVIKAATDKHLAENCGAINDINIFENKIYIRLERFDDDYVIEKIDKVI